MVDIGPPNRADRFLGGAEQLTRPGFGRRDAVDSRVTVIPRCP